MVATKTTEKISCRDDFLYRNNYEKYIKEKNKQWVSLDELRKYIDEKLEYDFCDNDWERGFQDGLKHIKERFFAPLESGKISGSGLSKEVVKVQERKARPGAVGSAGLKPAKTSLASHRKRENKR